ncbi:MAG: phage virion morphogenesis protein [Gluconacetobacter sp.]
MAQIRLTGTMREITSALDRIAAIGRNPSRVLAAVGEELIQSTQRRFETQTASDGTPWAPPNPHYAADKAAARHRPLAGSSRCRPARTASGGVSNGRPTDAPSWKGAPIAGFRPRSSRRTAG